MMDGNLHTAAPGTDAEASLSGRLRRSGDLSYKFQRLRERLRHAVVSGELTGKLPGERALAQRYNCNAKTLSKALTDLAAEGLLDRSIGRGTYVKGSAPVAETAKSWLVLGGGDWDGEILKQLSTTSTRCQLMTGEPQTRPSFLNQFSAVIDAGPSTPESFVRDLVVRSIPVVVVGREPRGYSTDAVLVDVAGGVSRLARELHALGHRRFVAVEVKGSNQVAPALRGALSRPGMDATVDAVNVSDAVAAVNAGASAMVCDSEASARAVTGALENAGISVPGQVSVVAVGVASGEPSVTGCYVSVSELADNAIRLLQDTGTRRPTSLWLAPVYCDRRTTAAIADRFRTDVASMGVALGR